MCETAGGRDNKVNQRSTRHNHQFSVREGETRPDLKQGLRKSHLLQNIYCKRLRLIRIFG